MIKTAHQLTAWWHTASDLRCEVASSTLTGAGLVINSLWSVFHVRACAKLEGKEAHHAPNTLVQRHW